MRDTSEKINPMFVKHPGGSSKLFLLKIHKMFRNSPSPGVFSILLFYGYFLSVLRYYWLADWSERLIFF